MECVREPDGAGGRPCGTVDETEQADEGHAAVRLHDLPIPALVYGGMRLVCVWYEDG